MLLSNEHADRLIASVQAWICAINSVILPAQPGSGSLNKSKGCSLKSKLCLSFFRFLSFSFFLSLYHLFPIFLPSFIFAFLCLSFLLSFSHLFLSLSHPFFLFLSFFLPFFSYFLYFFLFHLCALFLSLFLSFFILSFIFHPPPIPPCLTNLKLFFFSNSVQGSAI